VHDRAAEYARCAALLQDDPARDGAAALFDTALNNGLAAIVAQRWPDEVCERGTFVRSARALLATVEEHGNVTGPGVVELADLDPPPEGADFMGPLVPQPTVVKVETLRTAIGIVAIPRHGRQVEVQQLRAEHVEALTALNADSALRVFFGEHVDELEERVTVADAQERRRARGYLDLLSYEDQERREEIEYVEQYTEIEDDVRVEPADCPVCGLQALIPAGFDSYLGEFAWGTCVACSYAKAFEVADFEGRDEAIDRAVNDPDR
jgi:hypothetical protein